MPLSVACLMTELSASRSEGLITITLAPEEIRFRMSAICPAASVLRLAMTTLETTPDALAWALIEQIISSRQPLPCSVLETPTTYLVVVPPLGDEPPHATRAKAPTIKAAIHRPALSGHSRCVTDDHLLVCNRPTWATNDFLCLPDAPVSTSCQVARLCAARRACSR